MLSVNPVSSVQLIRKTKKQLAFWKDVCRSFGPRGYESLPTRRISRYVESVHVHNTCNDLGIVSSPSQWDSIKKAERKEHIENKWNELTRSK